MSKKKTSGLGRGLSALMSDSEELISAQEAALADGGSVEVMGIDELVPNPWQPRKFFDEDKLTELAASIRQKGLVQPILVRPTDDGSHHIIAGERRWRAAQRAGLHEVPVVKRAMSDAEALELAIIENVQRSDLGPLEEARAYQRLMSEFSHTQEAMAEIVGKSRSHIANLLRLLTLPEPVCDLVEKGHLTMGHARCLVGHPDAAQIARKIVDQGLSVRQTESLAKDLSAGDSAPAKAAKRKTKDADTAALERDLSNILGLSVELDHKGDAGRLVLKYKTLDQLDDLCERLTQGATR